MKAAILLMKISVFLNNLWFSERNAICVSILIISAQSAWSELFTPKSLLILVVILLVAGFSLAVYFGFGGDQFQEAITSLGDQVTITNRIMNGPVVLLRGTDGAPAEVAFLLNDLDREQLTISYFDEATGEVRWQSEPFSESATSMELFAADSHIFGRLNIQPAQHVPNKASQRMAWRTTAHRSLDEGF